MWLLKHKMTYIPNINITYTLWLTPNIPHFWKYSIKKYRLNKVGSWENKGGRKFIIYKIKISKHILLEERLWTYLICYSFIKKSTTIPRPTPPNPVSCFFKTVPILPSWGLPWFPWSIFVSLESDRQGSWVVMREAFYHLLPTPVYFILHFSRTVFILEWRKRQSGWEKSWKASLDLLWAWGNPFKIALILGIARWAAPCWQGWELPLTCRGGTLMLKYSVHSRSI